MKSRFKTKKLLLLGILLFGLSVATWAQKVSLNYTNVELQDVLLSIKKQTGYVLVFSDQILDVHRRVSIKVEGEDLVNVLKELLSDGNVTFEIKNKKIYFILKELVDVESAKSWKITGVVKDVNGEPIIGANILVKGQTTGVISDVEGKFSITVSSPKDVLVISYIGYNTVEMIVGEK